MTFNYHPGCCYHSCCTTDSQSVSQSFNLLHTQCQLLYQFSMPTVFVYRCQLYVQRYMKSTVHLPVTVSLSLPVVNLADHKLSQLSKHKLYIQFRRHPSYCLVSDFYSKIKCCRSILGCFYAFWGNGNYMNKYTLACRSHEILTWCKQLHIQLQFVVLPRTQVATQRKLVRTVLKFNITNSLKKPQCLSYTR